MQTWHPSHVSTDNNAATSSDDDEDNQHLDTQRGRVQVLLRTELGQLDVQMFVGLLHGMRGMCIYDDDDHRRSVNNARKHRNISHNYFHNFLAPGLQAVVRRQ